MIVYKDIENNFFELFNEDNGFLLRSNVLDSNGKQTNIIPNKRNFPELIDIGIMGKCHVENIFCKKMGIGCYQSKNNYDDMTLSDYKKIIDQAKGKTFQVALGGKGDPNKHPYFKEILRYTREHGIVPNLTTSGYNLLNSEIEAIEKYCGAVAVSMYSKIDTYTRKETNSNSITAINSLIKHNIKTNIHYVISNNTIDDIILRLRYGLFPNGINAIIFLLCKNVGRSKEKDIINVNNDKFKEFINLLKKNKYKYKFGFDSCFTPIIIDQMCINKSSIDYCEAARFSCYISPNMIMYPCSFVQAEKYGISLNDNSISEVWKSEKFNTFKMKSNNNFEGECAEKLNNIFDK